MHVEGLTRGGRSAEMPAGALFAGFRIERTLGRGGMGIVYLARESGLERLVALKVIREEVADDERFRERFRLESRTAASIEHPRVVTVFAAGEEDGLPYVAMKYVPGPDLQRVLSTRGLLGPEEATAIIAQVAAGLDAVHSAGLVHRDVKPANVIVADRSVDADGPAAYLADFGLAKALVSSARLTAAGEVIGTVDYMAPEQIQADRVDARTDVYALGCVLFHAVTGEAPFAGRESSAKMWAHLNEPPPSASERVGTGPAALDSVIRRAMAKDPERRFPSAGALGRAAVAATLGEAVTEPERPVGAGEAAPTAKTLPLAAEQSIAPTARLARRRRGRRWKLALALMLIVLAGLGTAALAPVSKLSVPGPDTGAGGVEVPDLSGEPLDEAEAELDGLGLRSTPVGGGLFGVVVSANWEVCDTSPQPSSTARPGSTVRLLIDRLGSC